MDFTKISDTEWKVKGTEYTIRLDRFKNYEVINKHGVRDYTGVTFGDALNWVDTVMYN